MTDVILEGFPDLLPLLSTLLFWTAGYESPWKGMEGSECGSLDFKGPLLSSDPFPSGLATLAARTCRVVTGRRGPAKERAIQCGVLEGLLCVLESAVTAMESTPDAEGNGHHGMTLDPYLGNEVAQTLEHLTARNVRAWKRVEAAASARGLLILSSLHRVAIQVLALTSMTAAITDSTEVEERRTDDSSVIRPSEIQSMHTGLSLSISLREYTNEVLHPQ